MSGWIVGVDAGGTTSRALARHDDTGETRSAHSEGANWTIHGPALCQERLSKLICETLPLGEEPSFLALCLAGYYPPDHAVEAENWAASQWPKCRARVEPDYLAAWAGAFDGKPGIIVIAGTGSIAYGRNAAGEGARAGGWGPLFGDEGSAYWIGRQALAHLAREEDVGKRSTRLFERMRSAYPHLGIGRLDWLRGVYREGWGREEVAALASHLEEHESTAASRIFQIAGKELASLARSVYGRLGHHALPVALLGGVGERSDRIRKAFAAALPAGCSLTDAEAGPVEGALRLAADILT